MNRNYASCKLSGDDERIHLKSTYGSQFTVSPDGDWLAFVDLHNVYIASFPMTGKTLDIGSNSEDIPVKKVSRDAGLNLHWIGDSKELHYTLGNEYYTIKIEDRFDFVAGKADSLFKMPEHGATIKLRAKVDKPKGVVAFKNAKIIT
ncbi:hypothetical protein BTE48_16780, partial [Oceanospirillum multiglobuliferum]